MNEHTTVPVCPHCGHEMLDPWDMEWGSNECIEVECGECESEYIVCIQTTITYSSYIPTNATT